MTELMENLDICEMEACEMEACELNTDELNAEIIATNESILIKKAEYEDLIRQSERIKCVERLFPEDRYLNFEKVAAILDIEYNEAE